MEERKRWWCCFGEWHRWLLLLIAHDHWPIIASQTDYIQLPMHTLLLLSEVHHCHQLSATICAHRWWSTMWAYWCSSSWRHNEHLMVLLMLSCLRAHQCCCAAVALPLSRLQLAWRRQNALLLLLLLNLLTCLSVFCFFGALAPIGMSSNLEVLKEHSFKLQLLSVSLVCSLGANECLLMLIISQCVCSPPHLLKVREEGLEFDSQDWRRCRWAVDGFSFLKHESKC